jgi:hypothetical protein
MSQQQDIDNDLVAKAYIKYAVNEVTDNTLTLGEFIKKIKTDKKFKEKYLK